MGNFLGRLSERVGQKETRAHRFHRRMRATEKTDGLTLAIKVNSVKNVSECGFYGHGYR